MPTHAERPDLYDAPDCRPGPAKTSQAYKEAATSDHVKERLTAKTPPGPDT